MHKLIIAAVLSISAGTAQAGTWTCVAHSKLIAGNAATGGMRGKSDVVDSWIPSDFVLTDETLTFENWTPLKLSIRNERRAMAHRRGVTTGSKKINVSYNIVLKEADQQALITMNSKGYKPMGPVVFNCQF